MNNDEFMMNNAINCKVMNIYECSRRLDWYTIKIRIKYMYFQVSFIPSENKSCFVS